MAPRAYREVLAPAQLRAAVECFWLRDAGAARSDGLILPDGCIDIIWAEGLDPFVAGPATLPAGADVDASNGIVGVRFRPGVARQVLGIDAQELLNRRIPLRDIWSRDHVSPWEAAISPPALDARFDAISALIAGRLGTAEEPDPLIRDIVAWIVANPRGRIEEIARNRGLSARQMRRRFAQSVGYGPKTLQRVLRMQRVLWLARADARSLPSLARLALAAGYADQAHMTRELVILTGLTPHQLLLDSGRGSAVSDLFKTTVGGNAIISL